jgi:glycosyltransferase involved in cell wall biosynthesis
MTSKPSLLVFIGDLPFPARKNGISIRYFPILEKASKEYDIDLICVCDYPIEEIDIVEAKKYCKRVAIFTRKHKKASFIKKITSRAKSLLPLALPYNLLHHDERDIELFLIDQVKDRVFDNALCVLLKFHHLFNKHVKATKKSLDLIDSPYATDSRKNSGGNLLNNIDLFQLKQWEKRQIKKSHVSSYISPLDRDICWKNTPTSFISIIPNGLYLSDRTDEKISKTRFTIGYLGHMGYPPNIKAALRLKDIFLTYKDKFPDSQLMIIGRDPAPEILAIQSDDVVVTGTVDNIWPYINSTDVFCFPMEIGSGQQNKLLEAMAAGVPVVSSPLGNSGVGAVDNESIILGDTDQQLAEAISILYQSDTHSKFIGDNGKLFVSKQYDWDNIYMSFKTWML